MEYERIIREVAEDFGIVIAQDGTLGRLDSLIVVNLATELEHKGGLKFDIDAITETTFASVEAIAAAMRRAKP